MPLSRDEEAALAASLGLAPDDEPPPARTAEPSDEEVSYLSPEGLLEIWPSNWDSLRLFTASATQWDHAGADGDKTGLRYDRLELVARMLRIDFTSEIFDDIQVLEAEALAIWGEQRAERIKRLEEEARRR